MILDQFGRPVRPGHRLLTPDWLMREIGRVFQTRDADRRIRDLRESVGASSGIGQTVQMRLPRRYQ